MTDRRRQALPVVHLLGALVLLGACQHGPPPRAFPTVATPQPVAMVPTYAERRILVSIQFGFDDASIRPGSIPVLNAMAEALNDVRLRGVSYEINGHTDLRGNFAYNIALSGLRAKAVSDYLRTHGVQSPPIRAQGFGPLQLLHPQQPFNPENRRVEIVALGPLMPQ